jgi:hypothetical protein
MSERVRLAKMAGCIANPTFIAIMEVLARKGNCVKDDFIHIEGISRLTVALNLKYLKKYGLINGSLTARNLSYCLNYDKIEEFKMLFDEFYRRIMQSRDPKGNCINTHGTE